VIGRRVPMVRPGMGRRLGLWVWHHPVQAVLLAFVVRMVWEHGL
jgi:hypothetical protein